MKLTERADNHNTEELRDRGKRIINKLSDDYRFSLYGGAAGGVSAVFEQFGPVAGLTSIAIGMVAGHLYTIKRNGN